MVKGTATQNNATTSSQRAERLRARTEKKRQQAAVEAVRRRVHALRKYLDRAQAEQARLRAQLGLQEETKKVFAAAGYTRFSMDQYDAKIRAQLIDPRVDYINKCLKMFPRKPSAFLLSNTHREESHRVRAHMNVLAKKGYNKDMAFLWHGIKGKTPSKALEGIAKMGFQEMPGARHIMGHGAYFSTHPMAAYAYTESDVRVVLLCLGILGKRENTRGKSDLRVCSVIRRKEAEGTTSTRS